MSWFKKPFPKGVILLWSGSIATIPAGWLLCDGSNGTPDLRNNFVVGAGDTYAVASTGGNLMHSHSVPDGSHKHDIAGGGYIGDGFEYNYNTEENSGSFNTDATNGLPPYYALCYIKKT